MKTLIASILIASSILLTGYTAVLDRADFSGKWELNKIKTIKENGNRKMLPKKLQVEQTKDNIKIASIISGIKKTATYAFDGKATTTIESGIKKSTIANWSDDGKEFSFFYAYFKKGHQAGVTIAQTWRIQDGSLYIETEGGIGWLPVEVYDK